MCVSKDNGVLVIFQLQRKLLSVNHGLGIRFTTLVELNITFFFAIESLFLYLLEFELFVFLKTVMAFSVFYNVLLKF